MCRRRSRLAITRSGLQEAQRGLGRAIAAQLAAVRSFAEREQAVLARDGIAGFTLKPPFDQLASAAKGDPRNLSAKSRDQLVEAILDAA